MSLEKDTYSVTDVGESSVPYIFPCKSAPNVLKTSLQTAVIADTVEYGPALFLGDDADNLAIQSTLADEGIYHRAFVHGAAAMCRRAPQSALVIGGGEGCMARELLKYDTIEVIDQVDWDMELLAYFKQPAVAAVWNGGAYEDPRVRLHVEDAFQSKVWEGKRYDLILIDLCDPSAESIDDLDGLLRKLIHRRSWDGVLLMNVGPVAVPLVLDVKRGRTGPPGFYTREGHICYTYSAELLGTMKFLAGSDTFSFKLNVPSFKAPWCLVGIAKNNTTGKWAEGFITGDELSALMFYEHCYLDIYGRTNSQFCMSNQMKQLMERAEEKPKDYLLYNGC
jgi:hypothetical protein